MKINDIILEAGLQDQFQVKRRNTGPNKRDVERENWLKSVTSAVPDITAFQGRGLRNADIGRKGKGIDPEEIVNIKDMNANDWDAFLRNYQGGQLWHILGQGTDAASTEFQNLRKKYPEHFTFDFSPDDVNQLIKLHNSAPDHVRSRYDQTPAQGIAPGG